VSHADTDTNAGTAPRDTCDQTGGVQGFFSRMFGGSSEKPLPPPAATGNGQATPGVQSEEEAKKKKSLFGKIVDAFKGDSAPPAKSDKNTPAPSKGSDSGTPPQ